MDQSYKPDEYVTRGKLNRMFKYFRKKKVAIKYIYNNSLGGHMEREYSIEYDSFEIRGLNEYFHVILFDTNKNILCEQEFDVGWWFNGLGLLEMINSGPRCYFTIKSI